MALFSTYEQVGAKEDVSDVITNISPSDTPFLSSIKTEKITQRQHQWQEDSLSAPADNAQVEGFDATDATLDPTVMRSNYSQILQKTFKVSGTADATDAYGRAKETAYQMAKAATEVKTDLEFALVGKVQAATLGDDTSTARRMASAFSQIDASVTVNTDSDSGTAGNQAGPLTEANVLAVDQALYTAGAKPKVVMIKPGDSLIFADFAKAAGRYRTFDGSAGQKIVNAVNLYVSPFGEKRVVLNRIIKTTEALVYDPDMWRLLTLRAWFRETLAKTGDSTKMMVCGEFSLKHRNQKASGRITNLT